MDAPVRSPAMDQWVQALRPSRNTLDPERPYAFFLEEERGAAGTLESCATVLITNRECPWRCVMCDLWKNTLATGVAPGAVPRQIAFALERLGSASTIKLYNSGSFFDRHAIPAEDHVAIARQVRGFARVIVESHPALVGSACLRFRDLLGGRLEVAMGLETAHPETLAQLNKGFTLDQFAKSAQLLREHGIDLRVFLLVGLPFLPVAVRQHWVRESLRFAFDCGATAVTLIATRGGNGAMEQLAAQGEFTAPRLEELERALEDGLRVARGRVFADLWEPPAAGACAQCRRQRLDRLRMMNRQQGVLPAMLCAEHG